MLCGRTVSGNFCRLRTSDIIDEDVAELYDDDVSTEGPAGVVSASATAMFFCPSTCSRIQYVGSLILLPSTSHASICTRVYVSHLCTCKRG
jgi:hypothetical protein